MACKYPYYPMYVDDFDEDPKVRALTLPELGLFQLCLNSSWRFNGLPDSIELVALDIRRREAEIAPYWSAVRDMYELVDGRLLNRKQELIRKQTISKSDKARQSIGKRWSSYERNTNVHTNVLPTNNVRSTKVDTNVIPRAYDSDYDSPEALALAKEQRDVVVFSKRLPRFEPDADRFRAEYPKEIDDEDMRHFISYMETPVDETLFFCHLPLHKALWKPGYVPKAATFLMRGTWKVPPKRPTDGLAVEKRGGVEETVRWLAGLDETP